MNDLLPTVVRYRINEITLEVCHGKIPDIFQALWFDPVTDLDLPDAKASDEEFQDWLGLYRHANSWFKSQLLEESQCN